MPAISPGTLAQNVINEQYGSEEEFLFAVADVMKNEYRTIVESGLLLQIDSPDKLKAMADGAEIASKQLWG